MTAPTEATVTSPLTATSDTGKKTIFHKGARRSSYFSLPPGGRAGQGQIGQSHGARRGLRAPRDAQPRRAGPWIGRHLGCARGNGAPGRERQARRDGGGFGRVA